MLLCLFTIALNSYHFFFQDSGTILLDFVGLEPFVLIENIYIKILLSIVLIALEATLLNQIILKHRLNKTLGLIPAAVFVLFASFCLSDQVFHQILLANLMAILSLRSLFGIYKKHLPITALFNAGFYMGIASILYQPYFVFLIALFLGIISLRSISIKETLQLITGFLAPFFFLFIARLYLGIKTDIFSSLIESFDFGINFQNFDLITWLPLILVCLLILTAILFKSENCKKKKYDAIKKIEISYWFLLLAIPAIFLVSTISKADFILISIPLALNLGLILETSSNKLTKEFLFLLSLVLYGLDLFF